MDIRRQRDMPHLGEKGFDGFGKTQAAVRTFQNIDNFSRWTILDGNDSCQPPALAPHQAFPGQQIFAPQEQHFDAAAGGFAGKKAGRDDTCAIDDQQVGGEVPGENGSMSRKKQRARATQRRVWARIWARRNQVRVFMEVEIVETIAGCQKSGLWGIRSAERKSNEYSDDEGCNTENG